MVGSLSMKNMVGFNSEKRLARYASTKSIMEEFFAIRMVYYQKRKDYMMSKLQRDV